MTTPVTPICRGEQPYEAGDGLAPAPESEMCDIASMPRFGKQTQFFDCELRQTNPISAAGKEEASAW